MIDLDKLEQMAKRIDPLPWKLKLHLGKVIRVTEAGKERYIADCLRTDKRSVRCKRNAAYIVVACNSLPDLIAENRALRKRVQTLEREIGDCNSEVSYWREEYEGEVQFAEDRIRELERQKKLLAAKVVEISNVKFCKDCKFRGPCYLNNAKVTEDTNVCVEAVIYWTEQTSKEVKSE